MSKSKTKYDEGSLDECISVIYNSLSFWIVRQHSVSLSSGPGRDGRTWSPRVKLAPGRSLLMAPGRPGRPAASRLNAAWCCLLGTNEVKIKIK